jgi:hypothetical protein
MPWNFLFSSFNQISLLVFFFQTYTYTFFSKAVEESEKRLNEVNEGRGEFPMVLGRSLNKIGGGISDMQAKPSESYDMIRHELIFREIAEQVKEVNSQERER